MYSGIVELPPTVDGIGTDPITLLQQGTAHAKEIVKVASEEEVWAGLGPVRAQPCAAFLQPVRAVGLQPQRKGRSGRAACTGKAMHHHPGILGQSLPKLQDGPGMLAGGSGPPGGILLVLEVELEMVHALDPARTVDPVTDIQHGDEMRGPEPLDGLLDLALSTNGKLRHAVLL